MRYHTTPMTIFFSVLLLALCVSLVWIGVSVLGLKDPGAIFAADLISSFDGDSDIRVEFSSLDRTFWRAIVVHDLSVSVKDGAGLWHHIADARKVTLSTSLQRLAWSFLFGRNSLSVGVEGLSIDLDDAVVSAFSSIRTAGALDAEEGSVPDDALAAWLGRTAFSIELQDGSALVDIGQADLSFSGMSGALSVGPALSLDGLSLDVSSVAGAYGASVSLDIARVSVSLRKQRSAGYRAVLSIASCAISDSGGGFHGTGRNLRLQSDISETLSSAVASAVLNFGLDSLSASARNASVDVSSVSGVVSLDLGADVSLEGSLNLAGFSAALSDEASEILVTSRSLDATVSTASDAAVILGLSSSGDDLLEIGRDGTELVAVSGFLGRLEISDTMDKIGGGVQWEALNVPQVSNFSFLADELQTLPFASISSTGAQANFSYSRMTDSIVAELYSAFSSDLTWTVPSSASGRLTASCDFDLSGGDFSMYADVSSLSVDSIPGETAAHYRWVRSNPDRSVMTLDLANEQAGLAVSATYEPTAKQRLEAKVRLAGFAPATFRRLLGGSVPLLEAYVDDSTRLVGNVQLEATPGAGDVFGWDGRGSFELGIIDLKVGKRFFNGATTFAGSLQDDQLDVGTFTATTEGYRLQYAGGLVLDNFLPEGELILSTAEDGRRLLRIDFSLIPPDGYSFAIDSEFAPHLSMTGRTNWQTGGIVNSEAILNAWGSGYPLSLTVDFSTFGLRLATEGLSLSAVLNDGGAGRIRIMADDFRLPRFSDALSVEHPLDISATMALDVPLDTYDWTFLASDVLVRNLPAPEDVGTLAFSIQASDQRLVVSDIIWDSGTNVPLEGTLAISSDSLERLAAGDFSGFSGTLYCSGGDAESASVSLFSDSDGLIKGLVDLSTLDVGRFSSSLGGLSLDLSVVGSSDLHRTLDLDGFASMVSKDLAANPTHLETSVRIHDDLISLDGISFVHNDLVFGDGNVSLDTVTGDLTLSVEASYTVFNKDRPRGYGLDMSVSSSLPLSGGMFALPDSVLRLVDSFRAIVSGTSGEDMLSMDIGVKNVVVGSDYTMPDATYRLSMHDGVASLSGGKAGEEDNIVGSYHFSDGTLDLTVRPPFLFGFTAKGTLTRQHVSMALTDIFFPLPLVNITFRKPIVWFLEGDIRGELRIEGETMDPNFYGMLWADRIDGTTFWLPQDVLSIKNPVVTIEEGYATTSWSILTSTNTETGKTVQGLSKASCALDGWALDYYQIEAKLEDDPVYIWLPILNAGVNVKGYATGDLTIYGEGYECWLSGPATVSDMSISFDISGLPSWYVSTGVTSTDMQVVTGKNVNLYFPSEDSPILSVTMDEGQKAAFAFDHRKNQLSVDGEVGFRTGEIYYFQKNFYVTEGSFRFRTDAFTQRIVPTINLRARIRDFDTSGDKVDIYLILQDSTLDNLSPRFESVPTLSTQEILQILGQSILPTTAYGQANMSTVVSLAATATDVISRLGLIDTGSSGLARTIKESLGLDMFTIRSNIVQNLLFDVLPGTDLVSSSATPLARYLDNTTVFLGKYLGRDFFLQGMIHFSAASNDKGTASFLADDLDVDMELSVEWANPMATFSIFTQPEELSLFSILDTIGFSATKRIEF